MDTRRSRLLDAVLRPRTLLLALPLLVAATPWTELAESDWLYGLATRFATVDGHQVHYPTPPAELAKLLEGRQEAAAWRHLADARLELGDRAGARTALEKWAQTEGPAAWDEAARWGAAHQDWPLAFSAADRALPGLPEEPRRALADERIRWADAHPDHADPLALRKARAGLFPKDPVALEDWLRALEKADRLGEADQALAASAALGEERRALLRSDLLADHGNATEAFKVLDAVVARPWSPALRQAYAARVEAAVPGAPSSWRATLERAYDGAALVRLATYFQGGHRGDACADLLRQVERRHEAALTRTDHLLVARLYQEIDAIPEAFRTTLAAAHLGDPEAQKADLALLARLALKAGGRPLALGTYNDEAYHWAARVDRTPGLWTGSVSFLLTGLPWKEATSRLETESLPDRTFATARVLADELARRAPAHPELLPLRVAIMERHVERGEGQAALALLAQVEASAPAVADQGRRVALLAMRLVKVPLAEEQRLMQARLKFLSPDGGRPALGHGQDDVAYEDGGPGSRPWAKPPREEHRETYGQVLDESISRLEGQDPSHQASLSLILAELDRMPDAEALWLSLAGRLEGWNLDDELGPRYERALDRFKGADLWSRLARWHARRSHHGDLRRLADAITQRFRGSEIFARTAGANGVHVEVPEQPQVNGRIRLVPWADWVTLKALERFPHSPTVFAAARHLITASQWAKAPRIVEPNYTGRVPVLVPDELMQRRAWALFFLDAGLREGHFAAAMHQGALEQDLLALEKRGNLTPVDDLILFEGWCRLSRFERAFQPADRLAAAYPGDGALAQKVLSLHRSLNGLDPTIHAALARKVAERTAPSLLDAGPLWSELGELEEDRGRPEAAKQVWANLLAGDARNPSRISELATLLWDYNHDREALAVVEAGRTRLGRPTFFAFETGVLRENLKDLEGAVREYLDALKPEGSDLVFRSTYAQDQRSVRRLAQLLGRDRVFRLVERRIQGLRPGNRDDERALAALFPLGTLDMPAPPQSGDDDWIDQEDRPSDPVGRAQRAEGREKASPKEFDAITRIGNLMLARLGDMVPRATVPEFLDAADAWASPLVKTRWKTEQAALFQNAVMARRAELTPNEEERIRQEMARAAFLVDHRLVKQADAVWAGLDARITALPEGATRLRAEAARATYLERAKGQDAAAAEWQRLTTRHAWSLGLLEDRVAFLNRINRGAEARALLESVIPKAAAGHREGLLERLTQDSLAASDLPRARRAVALLLAEGGLEPARRLGALHLLARLSLREQPAWDAMAAAKAECAKLDTNQHAELYQQLARAADLESAHGVAMPLWIEALNRRTDRDWLREATRSAQKAGKAAELLDFFEKQRARSPRDVRWVVAVRDIKRDLHQVEGALEAARAAVAVRPEREDLWKDAADLLVRADRPKEAADFLEGWNRPRLADEGVARWRSELYARAGDAERALAIEQGALQAYRKEAPKDADQLADRRARAAERLLACGLPRHALRLYSPTGDVTACTTARLSRHTQADLALLTGQFVRLITLHASNHEYLSWDAQRLAAHGRTEQMDEVQAFLLGRMLAAPGTFNRGQLETWWSFVRESGLEPSVRMALARHLLGGTPGPWQGEPPLPFVEGVSQAMLEIGSAPGRPHLLQVQVRTPDLTRLWSRDLARRDRPDELVAFLEPRWKELVARVHEPAPTAGDRLQQAAVTALVQGPLALLKPQPVPGLDRLGWTAALDDAEVLGAWARGAAKRPEKARELAAIMSERRLWDRFWSLAARGWSTGPLVDLLPEPSRMAWFRLWEGAPRSQDPIFLARRREVEDVTLALGRLVAGTEKAADQPLIVRLRGPQSVGEVLGRNAAWTWPTFAPRRNAKGEVTETGEDRVIGTGVDAGRLPGALWGERPGEAWYVLEALARYRQGDATAPLVPLDVPARGAESDRTLLAIRLARGLKDLPLALELEAARPGALGDRPRLEQRLSLLTAAQRKDEAVTALQAFLKHAQPKLNEGEFRWAENLAREHGLPAAMDLLDPETPVGPAFLAYLVDRRKDAADRFHTANVVGFRAALASRWAGREPQLSADQVRFWLRELWLSGSARLPERGLRRLGGIWPHASGWLNRLPVSARPEALDALEGLQASPALFALLAEEKDDVARLLAVRARLLRGEQAQALALVDGLLAELRRSKALTLSTYMEPRTLEPPQEGGEGEEGDGDAEPQESPQKVEEPVADAVKRLEAWLTPFRQTKAAAPVEERFRRLLKERRDEGAVGTDAWRLAFVLTPAGELPALAADLDTAWFRGDVQPEQLGTLCRILARVMPSEAPRWMARWPRPWHVEHALERAAVLASLKQPEAAARSLVEARDRSPWEKAGELRAFDQWRRLGVVEPQAPAAWREAVPFWSAKAETVVNPLGDRLKTHPHDVLAARAALRCPAPGEEQALYRAVLALPDRGEDRFLLEVRAARGLLAGSWRAAAAKLGHHAPAEVLRLLVRRRMKTADINAVLADLARLAHRKGDEGTRRTVLGLLEDRKAPGLKALRTELGQDRGAAPTTYRMVDGHPASIRPRDLTWAILAQILKTEGVQ